MSTVRFFLDEDSAGYLGDALIQQEPAIDISWVGDGLSPPKETPDLDNLAFAESNQLAIISKDKRTLPKHVKTHQSRGGHTWGVFLLRPGYPVHRYVDDIILIWSASEAEEWRDRIEWLPW